MTNPPTRRPLQLTREQVLAKYGPVPNTYRTPEALEAFLAALPKPCTRSPDVVKAGEARAMLVRDYGGATLKAQRMGGPYVSALGSILGLFAKADSHGREYLVSHRDSRLGPQNIIRNVQEQMHRAGLLVKETRPQGRGFVGTVYVYASETRRRRFRKATPSDWEQLQRQNEGKCRVHAGPANLTGADVPY